MDIEDGCAHVAEVTQTVSQRCQAVHSEMKVCTVHVDFISCKGYSFSTN
jgi:hypothetical protein